jgi:hypothetical protein
MFCPKRKVEYRPGFTRCADCDTDLVDVLPEKDSPSGETLITLWECADETECVDVCQGLRSAGIPYDVEQIPYETRIQMRVDWHYRVLISRQALERAKTLVVDTQRRDRYLQRWLPEDAAVWSQNGDDLSSAVANSLDANYIHSRCDSDRSGIKKVFVPPEDEISAREIVREIVEGAPPE